MDILKIKQLIIKLTKHFNYDDLIINILTICYVAIVSIDHEVSDILEEVLSTKYILENDGSFTKMLRQYYPNLELNFDTYLEPSFNNEECLKDDFIIIYPENYINTCYMLEAFLHELKHAMNSIINRYKRGENAHFRCGISYITIKDDYKYFRYVLLEESFNSFITKIYLNQILKLKKIQLNDKEIIKLLRKFHLNNYEYSYNSVTKLLEPLFCDPTIFTLFYNASLYKDYKPLINKLESIFKKDLATINSLLEDCYYDDKQINCLTNPKYQKRKLAIKFPDIEKMIP